MVTPLCVVRLDLDERIFSTNSRSQTDGTIAHVEEQGNYLSVWTGARCVFLLWSPPVAY